ncbi:PAS domain S-box protein [Aromatoleum toluclasticum]|uniref:PAS domain S-box protein n=1 Tax=Aromatoleum toluclasticum TaxID=92003 RepID=UPI001D1955AA|nr:PAS domain S-box protein [Aromatoleum toluclasticum]MCC4118233.1 PAS domain S-box protein [Aromatoleum toluclasticum]
MKNWPFHRFVFLLIATIAIPLLTSTIYSFFQIAESRHDAARRLALDIARDSASRVHIFLQETLDLATTIAGRPQVLAIDPDGCDPILGDLLILLPKVVNLSVIDRQGLFVCSARTIPQGAPQPQRHSAFDRALKGESSFSEPIIDELSKRWIIGAAVPVRDMNGGVAAVLTISVDLSVFPRFVVPSTAPPNAVVFITDEHGRVVAHSRYGESWIGKQIGNHPLWQARLSAQGDTIVTTGPDGYQRGYGVVQINDQGWRAFAGIPAETLFSETDAEIRLQSAIAGLVVLVLGLGTVVLLRRIVQPLRVIASGLHEIAHGNRHTRLPATGPREFDEFAQAFNDALDAREQAELRFQTIFERAGIGMAVFDPSDGRILQANQALADMLGYPLEQLSLLGIKDVSAPRADERHDDPWHQLMAGEHSGFTTETPYLRKDGRERIGWLTLTLVQTADSRPKFIIGMLEDITEQRRAEAAVRGSARRYQVFFEQRIFGVKETDVATGQLLRVNQTFCDLLGYREAELLNLDIRQITHPDDLALTLDHLEQLATGKSLGFMIEKRYLRKDGATVWASLYVVALWGPGEPPGRYISIIHDISDRKRAETAIRGYANAMRRLSLELTQVEERERQTLHRELHDQVGANMAALQIELELIRNALPESEREKAGKRLQDARQLLRDTMTQIRNVMNDLRPSALDDFGLPAALRNYAQLLSERMGIPVEVNGPDIEPRPSSVVETTLFRIAQEALTNAAKYSGADRILIDIVAGTDTITLTIADDGRGFDADSGKPQGGGWGLKTMRERAQAIDADLRIDSAPGRGTQVVASTRRNPE